jgi:hypothetical protein
MNENQIIQIYMSEYEQLFSEIKQRLQTQHSLFITSIAACGVLISAAITAKNTEILLSMTFILSATLLEWSNQDRQIWKIANYINKWICPKIRKIIQDEDALEWTHSDSTYRINNKLHSFVHAFSHSLLFAGGMIIGLVISRHTFIFGINVQHSDGFIILWWINLVIFTLTLLTTVPTYWVPEKVRIISFVKGAYLSNNNVKK